jgi:DNA-directed RNA polymerase specialized sigma24 family protein
VQDPDSPAKVKIMAISRKTALKGNPEAGPRGSSRTDRTTRTQFLAGLEQRLGRTLLSMKATNAGDSGPGSFPQEFIDAGDGGPIKTSTDPEQLLLRWQKHGDREAWDRLAVIVMQAARRCSVVHRRRLKSSSFDLDDVTQEALLRFVREADHIHPYSIHGFIRILIDRSAIDLNRKVCRAKRGGGGTVPVSVCGKHDSHYREGKACSADSLVHLLATQEGLHCGLCFDESEMFYIRRALEAYSDHADETSAKARWLAELLSSDTRALAEGLGCSQRTILRQRANMRSQLESGLHLLRDEYRSVGKNDDALAVTELMQKLKRVADVRPVKGLAVRR